MECDTRVTLIEEDLEKIAVAVTLPTEEKFLALEEQQKAIVETLQAKLQALQIKDDTLQTSMI